MAKKELMYSRYERFWHWNQAAFILLLIVTGFEIHGSFLLLGFEKAVALHQYAAYGFILLTVFTIFWHVTTGEWKQYIPTRKFLIEYIHFYFKGIFQGAPHPTRKERLQKLNPLQRATYFSLKVMIIPLQTLTGLIYLYYPEIRHANMVAFGLETTALLHTMLAFTFIAFLLVHIYLTTTGDTLSSNIKAMVTGYEEISNE